MKRSVGKLLGWKCRLHLGNAVLWLKNLRETIILVSMSLSNNSQLQKLSPTRGTYPSLGMESIILPLRSCADDHTSWRSGLATAGAACSYFVTVGFLNAFGVFQEYYTSTLLRGYSDFQISWLGSFALFAFFAGAPAAGILSDKYGPTVSFCSISCS